ncbi:MAG: hypothetical protein HY721_14440 [Planctomycetes bacterium]|nr:hypothetical protein [Planctomycetota bacterium]
MLRRYQIPPMYGRFPPDHPALNGIRQKTTFKTQHCLRPTKDLVDEYLAHVTEAAWRKYERLYFRILEARFLESREPFDKLAAVAGVKDLFLGCYCPTETNPDPDHCHTFLAVRFMKEKYPELEVDLNVVRYTPPAPGVL